MRTPWIAAAALLLLAACSESTLPTGEWVRARATGQSTLAVTNRGDQPIYVRVSDPTVLDVSVGCSPQTCTRLGAGETLRVPYAEIVNYDAGDAQAAVRWWVFGANRGTRATGTVVVQL